MVMSRLTKVLSFGLLSSPYSCALFSDSPGTGIIMGGTGTREEGTDITTITTTKTEKISVTVETLVAKTTPTNGVE